MGALGNLAGPPWVARGAVKFKEDRSTGIESTPEQFCKLARGDNFGKTLVILGGEPG